MPFHFFCICSKQAISQCTGVEGEWLGVHSSKSQLVMPFQLFNTLDENHWHAFGSAYGFLFSLLFQQMKPSNQCKTRNPIFTRERKQLPWLDLIVTQDCGRYYLKRFARWVLFSGVLTTRYLLGYRVRIFTSAFRNTCSVKRSWEAMVMSQWLLHTWLMSFFFVMKSSKEHSDVLLRCFMKSLLTFSIIHFKNTFGQLSHIKLFLNLHSLWLRRIW